MRRTIEGKRYDTDTATQIGHWWNGYASNDFNYVVEDLYKTPKGNFFLVGEGGPMTGYAEQCGNGYGYGEALIPMSRQRAMEWCAKHGLDSVIDEHFSDLVEEA